MIQSWKRRLVGGIALAVIIAFGSTAAATSLRADSGWSWEGAVVGGIIGGLLGSTSDERYDHLATVGFATAVDPFYDGPFIIHHHHAGWHKHPWHHRHGWHIWLGHQGPRYVHSWRYHHRQWHSPQVQLRTWPAHPPGHQHRQAHNQRAHQQPQHAQAQRQQHGHGHGHHTHQQARHAHPQVHRHGHAHRW